MFGVQASYIAPLSGTNVRQISICTMACLKVAWKLREKPHLAKLYVRKNPVDISMFGDLKLRKHQTQGYPLTSLLTESSVNVAFSANNNLLLLNHFISCPIYAETCTGECIAPLLNMYIHILVTNPSFKQLFSPFFWSLMIYIDAQNGIT